MPNMVKRDSAVVDMLSKVPVHRGSLVKIIDNLLKTIESSESAVMIPTLLRDKCDFDAWELLFVAKILKASILGHIDLVEFYINHIGLSESANGAQPPLAQAKQQPACQPQPAQQEPTEVGAQVSGAESLEPSLSISSKTSSATTCSSTLASRALSSWAGAGSGGLNSSASSDAISGAGSLTCTSSSASDSISSSIQVAKTGDLDCTMNLTEAAGEQVLQNGEQGPTIGCTRNQRHAQPPSLLQLTTTNNHINSLNTQLFHLESYSNNNNNNNDNTSCPATPSSANEAPSGLCISSWNPNSPTSGAPLLERPSQSESLRPSRSAGCLFRLNSGASSPRTPQQTPAGTPCPQAETLANGLSAEGLFEDPSAPVRLLLQIEQLKSSINHVTSLLESVVELYKKSIDTIHM